MASQWIVMVNRIPRGPLSEEEILTLFSKNLISRNDLAYLVPENASEGTAEWKFLWQFPSFDRRKNENLSTNPAELTEAQRKRRTDRTPEKIKEEVKAILPEEFSMIKMEDLVLHTKQGASLLYNSEQDHLKQTPELPFSFEIKGKSLWLGLGGSLFLLVGIFFLNQEYEKKQEQTAVQLKANETSSRTPTFVLSPVSPSHLDEEISGNNAPRNELPLAPSNNSTGHSNELLLEEYKKHLQMRMEKENADAAQIMEVIKAREETSEEDEAEDDSPRKKKKKRKTASESEEESGSEAE